MGPGTEQTQKPRRSTTSWVHSSKPKTCDDWLRELFSGTLDLRDAEARRRSTRFPGARPNVHQTER
jgi:hypothetical protein